MLGGLLRTNCRSATYIMAAYVAGAAEPPTIQERNPNEHLAGRAFLATAAAQA